MRKVRNILIIMGVCIASIPAVAQAAAPLVLTTSNCDSLYVNATLKSDLTCPQIIDINGANITLNLNGYTLGTGDGNVVNVNASGFTLTGGTIRVNQDDNGVYANGYSTLNISKVNFVSVCGSPCENIGININGIARANISNSKFSGLRFGLFSGFSNVNLSSSTFNFNDEGFYSNFNPEVTITGSSFINNEGTGIRQDNAGSFNVSSSKADNNLIGMALDPNYVGVVNINSSFARNNGGTGIVVWNSKFAGKTSSIINTVASDNNNQGFDIYVPGSMTFKGNLANRNGGAGVIVNENAGGNGPLTGSYNSANYNGGWGFYAQYPVAGTGNTATGNSYAQCSGFVCKK